MNEAYPMILAWTHYRRLKQLGHPDPIGDLDLYTFDVICEIEGIVARLQREADEREMQKNR